MSDKLSLLIIPFSAAKREALEQHFATVAFAHLHWISQHQHAAARAHLQNAAVDAVLLDIEHNQPSQLAFFRELVSQAPATPILLLADADDHEVATQCLREGAADYLVQADLHAPALRRALLLGLERQRRQQQLSALLTQEHLARITAEHAVKNRDEWIAIATHELKNPITSMHIQSQLLTMLAQQENPPKFFQASRPILVNFEKQTAKLNALIEHFLDVSRVESEQLSLEITEVNLSKLLIDIVDSFAYQLKKAHCTVNLNCEENVIGQWDAFYIERALTNLLSNAIKYGGGKPITIDLTHDAVYAHFEIRDQGMGIPADEMGRLFNRYERLGKSHQLDGLGLGLYITQKVIKAHQGRITVQSEYGQGASFRIELPLTQAVTSANLKTLTASASDCLSL